MGNRELVMELLSFVDLFFILETPAKRNEEKEECERAGFELFSFCKGSGVEVFVKTDIVGLVSLVRHNEWSTVVRYNNNKGEEKLFGGVYLTPGGRKEEAMLKLNSMDDCDTIAGDLNARHPRWGATGGDNHTNTYGYAVNEYAKRHRYRIDAPDVPTFRDISAIDICLKKGNERSTWTDKAALEHQGIITRLDMEIPINNIEPQIAWKKVDWREMENQLKVISEDGGGWNDITELVNKQPRKRRFRGKDEWYNEEIARMAADTKFLRRSGRKEEWSLARKVLSNRLIQGKYDNLKNKLSQAKDPEIFRMIKNLEGRRSIPPIKDKNGQMRYCHEEISDIIAEQIESDKPREWSNIEVDITVNALELRKGLDRSPGNTAGGYDGISYPFLRFWMKHQEQHMVDTTNHLIRYGEPKWHEARTVLIQKAGKDDYQVAEAWRMIHLLPTMAKVIDRIILQRMEKDVVLGDTQYGSRKGRSCHDSVKQTMEFLKYHEGSHRAVMTMDVEGGFDNIRTDLLIDILRYKSCDIEIVKWIDRWMSARRMRLKFNRRISKAYRTDKGVPQGSPISPYLFGVYVEEIFKPRILHTPARSCIVSSYVDDGMIAVAGESQKIAMDLMVDIFEDCNRIAKQPNMSFALKKTEWMGMGKKRWNGLATGEGMIEPVDEIRILGYRMEMNGGWRGHTEYWLERGVDVRRRIAGIGRRYGSSGGIGAWEYNHLIKSVYLPTVWYGLEFVADDEKMLKKIQININDIIRSGLRTPIKTANNILLAEAGIVPTHIQAKYLRRRCRQRDINNGYGKDYPWYRCVSAGWDEQAVIPFRNTSEHEMTTRPVTNIAKDKSAAVKGHTEMMEILTTTEGASWVYSDGARRNGKGAVGWVWMEGEGLITAKRGIAIHGKYDSVRIELAAIACAMDDAVLKKVKKCILFTDCIPAIRAINSMQDEGKGAGIWNILVPIMNQLESVEIHWTPGHVGIEGNEAGDKTAGEHIDENVQLGRWNGWDEVADEGGRAKDLRLEEWSSWYTEQGHEYYKRKPAKPRHLKGLSRQDAYVLIRIRSGTDKTGHDECEGHDERFHMTECCKYADRRPPANTLFNDKHIGEWRVWWTYHEYLGMGIPTTLPEQLGVRVMFGNPFDSTITISRNGETVTENVERPSCDGCGKSHVGACVRRMTDMRGRWFFLGEAETRCGHCGGNYGGGSNPRPGGSGLKMHLNRRKDVCGRALEIEYWKNEIGNKMDWDEEFRVAMVNKWIERNCTGRKECWECRKVYKTFSGLRQHIRTYDVCFRVVEKMMVDDPAGTGGD